MSRIRVNRFPNRSLKLPSMYVFPYFMTEKLLSLQSPTRCTNVLQYSTSTHGGRKLNIFKHDGVVPNFTSSSSLILINPHIRCNPTRILSREMVVVTNTSTQSNHEEQQPQVTVNTTSTTTNESFMKVSQDNDSIIITAQAVERIHYLAKMKNPENPDDIFLRVFVDAGGCSGFQYKFEIGAITKSNDDDDNHNDEGINPDEDILIHAELERGGDDVGFIKTLIVVDEVSLEYIKGSTIDYVTEMIKSSFAIVSNPQSESACGCGSSFAMKHFEANPALD